MKRLRFTLLFAILVIVQPFLRAQQLSTVHFKVPEFTVGFRSPAGHLDISRDTFSTRIYASESLVLPKGIYNVTYTNWLGTEMDTIVHIRKKHQQIRFHAPLASWREAGLQQLVDSGDSICYFSETYGCFGPTDIHYGWLKWKGDTLYGNVKEFWPSDTTGTAVAFTCKIHKQQLLQNIEIAIHEYEESNQYCGTIHYHHSFMTRGLVYSISLSGCLSEQDIFASQ